jgi:adenylate cyclase
MARQGRRLRRRGGQVLKFIGDGMLATFSFEEPDRAETCRRAIEGALEAQQGLDAMNRRRAAAGMPLASVDLALHIGDVLYGNVGATDRLDFTVIGPAVNEAARIEALCSPLSRSVLVSREFAAAAAGGSCRFELLGRHALRGVREPKDLRARRDRRMNGPFGTAPCHLPAIGPDVPARRLAGRCPEMPAQLEWQHGAAPASCANVRGVH